MRKLGIIGEKCQNIHGHDEVLFGSRLRTHYILTSKVYCININTTHWEVLIIQSKQLFKRNTLYKVIILVCNFRWWCKLETTKWLQMSSIAHSIFLIKNWQYKLKEIQIWNLVINIKFISYCKLQILMKSKQIYIICKTKRPQEEMESKLWNKSRFK